jgi:hypothetical protein
MRPTGAFIAAWILADDYPKAMCNSHDGNGKHQKQPPAINRVTSHINGCLNACINRHTHLMPYAI